MDSYTFALALGGAGLVAMAASGVAHLSDHGGQDSGPDSHDMPLMAASHHANVQHSGQAASGHQGVHRGAHHGRGAIKTALLALVSPRTIFSLLVGFGLTGLVGRNFAGGLVLFAIAVLGGIAFEMAVVGPVWNFLFRFASTPAGSLEGSLMSEALATSGFDTNGQGLVAIEVDGQVVQCLGTLRSEDRDMGIRVRAGDRLRVEDVDASRSRCTVSYVAHGLPSR